MGNRLTENLDRNGFHRWILWPVSGLYALGWTCYLAMYQLGLKKAKKPHRAIVCVGNLAVGGSGKTPMTCFLAKALRAQGEQVVISMSGYGFPKSEAASLAPDGPLDPQTWGDEPALMRQMLPDVPLIVGRRRVLAAEICAQHFPDAVLVLDDGFQHLPLQKDFSIVMHFDVRNSSCLPAGPMREPVSNLRRADCVLPRDASLTRLTEFKDESGQRVTAEQLRGLQFAIVTAIANPYRLIYLAEEHGAQMLDGVFRADHDPLIAPDLLARIDPGLPLLTTGKDWVKLKSHPAIASRRVIVADYRWKMNEDREKELLDRILAKLGRPKSTAR